jgi:tetratricopeptide (TPR) repeat protein
MNHRRWLLATYCLAAGLAFSLTGTSSKHALALEGGKHATKSEASPRPPLTVVNPYATSPPAADKQSLAGYQVDPEVPPIYRLPSIDEEVAAPPVPADNASLADDAPSAEFDIGPISPVEIVASLPENTVAPTDEAAPAPEQTVAESPEPTTATSDQTVASSSDAVASSTDQNIVATNDDILPIPAVPEVGPSYDRNQRAKYMTAFSASSAEMVPYMPVTAGLSAQLLPSVQRAYALAQRGSLYAAQTEFVQVLRRIAQAKDADEGYDDHSRALAAGLRALDEAEDFAPTGVQLEAEMNVAVTVSSHRTPVLRNGDTDVLPQEAIAEYHYYAQQQLAKAVAAEQAGSMALHGLGKVYCRLAEETPNDARHERKAMTMFLAALDAGPQNHLAANEVGVLLSRGGHEAEAAAMFKRSIDVAPNSTAYRNLAVAERKLGQLGQAGADGKFADMLAARERAAGAVSRSKGVEWVTPQELAGVAQPQPLPPSQIANPQTTRPMMANRSTTPLGPSPGPTTAQPTHAPNTRWW